MTKSESQTLSQKLTIEYLHAHPDILSGTPNNIPDMVEQIANINKLFYDNIIHNPILNSIYSR